MPGVSQFACVQLYGFHSSFLIVFSPYTEDDPRSQHLVVRPTGLVLITGTAIEQAPSVGPLDECLIRTVMALYKEDCTVVAKDAGLSESFEVMLVASRVCIEFTAVFCCHGCCLQ